MYMESWTARDYNRVTSGVRGCNTKLPKDDSITKTAERNTSRRREVESLVQPGCTHAHWKSQKLTHELPPFRL